MRLKKRRGVFYTPPRLAEILVGWTVRSEHDVIIEPSFGGCDFIAAIERRLVELGSAMPQENIYGCDIDPAAFTRHLPQTLGAGFRSKNFRKGDFLSVQPDTFRRHSFTAAIGNPPYVAYHNMFKKQRVAAMLVGEDADFRLSGMASLWAYFVFHALRFLGDGGRMAWLLPGSLLHADYGKTLLRELARRFTQVGVISLHERQFLSAGVSETTEVLVCDGHRRPHRRPEVQIAAATSLDDCAAILGDWSGDAWAGSNLNGRAVPALAPTQLLAAFERVRRREDVVRLSDLSRISIGVVTGANRIFVVDEATAKLSALPNAALKPIFAKFATAPGIELLAKDLAAARAAGMRSLFVDGTNAQTSPKVRAYFEAVPRELREANVTFRKHADWRCPDDKRIPDAFFPYMHHDGPRVVLNGCGANATNTIHRMYFNSGIDAARQRLVAVSLLSSFSQLSAEIEGRSYGGGVLKHEPTEASRVQLIAPIDLNPDAIDTVYRTVDELLRQGQGREATDHVDAWLFAALKEPPSRADWQAVRSTLRALRARRQRR